MEMLTKQLPAFSSEQLDMLDICSIISFTSACIALGAGWRGDCSSHALNGSLLQSPVESLLVNRGARFTESDGHCQSIFSLIHPKTSSKGSSPDEKGTLLVFIKVLQCEAAYPRTCTTVHNVSKEIICLGRCCRTWKHLPAARFHQRADLRIDFPSMTSSICRAFKGSFISPAVVRDSSNMTKQLMKRLHKHCPISNTESPKMGWWQKQSHGNRGKGGAREMLWAQPTWAVMSSAGNGISQSVFEWKPTSSSGDKAQESACASTAHVSEQYQERCDSRQWKPAHSFTISVSPLWFSACTGMFLCIFILFAMMSWATFWWLMTHNRLCTTGSWNNEGRKKSGRKLE